MEKRTILISLAVAFCSFFISKLLLNWHKTASNYFYSENGNFIYPLFSSLSTPISSSSWFIPGMIAGYLSTKNPIKHGAFSGLLFGLALGALSLVLSNSQAHEVSMKLANLSYAMVTIIENVVLFSISAAFGHLLSKRVTAL